MQKIIYMDHAATTPIEPAVLKEMIPYFTNKYGNPSSIYSLGIDNKNAINKSRYLISKTINCKENEIYFTSGGTESDNMIIKGIALSNMRRGRHIITSKIEHPAVIETCKFLERYFGFRITYLNVDNNGRISLNELERSIYRDTILITIMYANNEIGTIQDIDSIGKIANKYNIYFHTDAVQAVGNIKIDVDKSNISALSMSAHKFYGPKGIGISYINENVNFGRLIDGGHQESDKRAGTENVAGIVGAGKAIQIAYNEIEEYNYKLKILKNYYLNQLKSNFKDIKINGDIENSLSGNVNVCFKNVSGEHLINELNKRGICASSGSACSSGFYQISKVLLAIGVPKDLAKGSLRITFGKENTINDIDVLIKALKEICV